jgi:hypothetical protein
VIVPVSSRAFSALRSGLRKRVAGGFTDGAVG